MTLFQYMQTYTTYTGKHSPNQKKITTVVQCWSYDKEHLTPGQAQQLFKELTWQKTYVLFKDEDGHGGHCQPLSRLTETQVAFDWIKQISQTLVKT